MKIIGVQRSVLDRSVRMRGSSSAGVLHCIFRLDEANSETDSTYWILPHMGTDESAT